MAYASDPRFLVLHAVRLKGFADDDVVATRVGFDPGAHLEALRDSGLAIKRDGRLTGWALTPDGRAHHAKLIADELSASGQRDVVEAGYNRFLAINQKILAVCTLWQIRTIDGAEVPNDHSDAIHDADAIARLAKIDAAVQPVCTDLAAALARYRGYGDRLAAARAKVEAGDTDWFTKPLIDSYHTVWFELHEDLLATLGIDRSKELTS
jgi:hypothetical protein